MVSDLYQRRNKYSSPKVTFSGASHAKDIFSFSFLFFGEVEEKMMTMAARGRGRTPASFSLL